MLNKLKKSSEIVFHLPSGKGYYVVNHKVIPFNLKELNGDTEILKYIMKKGVSVEHEIDIEWKTRESIFTYSIYNNGSYELDETIELYSFLYLTQEEFDNMCKEAQQIIKDRGSKRWKDVYEIGLVLKEKYKDVFIELSSGQGYNTYEFD